MKKIKAALNISDFKAAIRNVIGTIHLCWIVVKHKWTPTAVYDRVVRTHLFRLLTQF